MKKIIFTLISALLLTCFAACGDTADTTAADDTNPSVEVNTEEPSQSEESTDESNAAGEQEDTETTEDEGILVENNDSAGEGVLNADNGDTDTVPADSAE